MSSGGIKPIRWPIHYGGVAPQHRWAWRNLSAAYMFWEGAQKVFNVLHPTQAHAIDIFGDPAEPFTWTPTRYGMACHSLGGSGGAYGFIADHDRYRCPGDWTIAVLATANFTTGGGGGGSMLAKGGGDDSAGNNHNYLLCYDNGTFTDDQAGSGWLVLFERADSVGANVSAKLVATVAAGDRVLIMGVLDTTRDQLRLYHNGILGRTRSTTHVAETNAKMVTVGRFSADSDVLNRWAGNIEGVWIWKDRAFTDQEASAFARNPWGPFTRYRHTVAAASEPPASTARSQVIICG